jgi:glycosyltransferase involved in cell wall biosynthesis
LKYVRGKTNSTRGSALNQGAFAATGDYLLFLHADCLVPPGYDETIRRELSNSLTLLTAFRFSYDHLASPLSPPPSSVSSSSSKIQTSKSSSSSFQIISFYYNMLSIFCLLPQGSQGYALTKQTFQNYQFEPSVFLMEDIHFIQFLRQRSLLGEGKIKILEQSVLISVDEILSHGILKHTCCQLMAYLLLFYTSLSEEFVYRWCYIRIPQSFSFLSA